MNVLDEVIPERSCYSGMPRTFSKFEDKGQNPYLQHEARVRIVDGSYRLNCSCGKFTVMGKPDTIFSEFKKHDAGNQVANSFCDERDAHLVTSFIEEVDGKRMHAPAIDIDLRVGLRESSPGKYHLYFDKAIEESVYFRLLDVMSDAGLVEEGYAAASRSRGFSALRLPDVPKAQPVDLAKVVANRKGKAAQAELRQLGDA